MTEAEWFAGSDLGAMVRFLGPRLGERKLRLFLCAVCRSTWDARTPGRTRRAVEAAERYADGLTGRTELLDARSGAWEVFTSFHEREARGRLAGPAAGRAEPRDRLTAAQTTAPAAGGLLYLALPTARRAVGDAALAGWLREVVGNPFRPLHTDPAWSAWNGGAVVRLAQAVYDDRALPSGHLDAARLAVLADMLEEAGCGDAELLGHLRGPGPHVRGCFALDLLLGRS